MSPTAEVGGRARKLAASQAAGQETLPLSGAQGLDSGASGTGLQLESERTAYAHGCAQRAGVTTQRRHVAAPALSPAPRQFCSQLTLPNVSQRAAATLCPTQPPSGPAKSEQRPCACDGRSPTNPQLLIPAHARNRGMSPYFLATLSSISAS